MAKSLRKIFAMALFCLFLLCLVPLQTLLAAEHGGDITTKRTILVQSIDSSEVTLASLNVRTADAQTGKDKVAFGLIWVQDSSGWLPMWKLCLKSDIDLIPTELPPSTGATAAQISSISPVQGHTYETILSYSQSLNVLSIRLVDTTVQQVLYSSALRVPAYDGALYAPDGSEMPYYLPIEFTWGVGTYEKHEYFIEQYIYKTRDTPNVVVRFNMPPLLPSSQYLITLDRGDHESQLTTVPLQPGENFIPLVLTSLPLGQSTLRLDYIRDSKTLLSETKQIIVGRLEFVMQPIEVDREAGTLHTVLEVTSTEVLPEQILVKVDTTISELVWSSDRHEYEQVPYKTQTVYNGPLNLSDGVAEIAVDLPLPDRPGNWQLSYTPSCEKNIPLLASSKVRLFSTHVPVAIKNGADYSFVVFPDTHVEPVHMDMLTRMTGWVAENAAKLNIAGVFQVGDVTSHNMFVEWEQAHESMSLLNGVVPYTLALGNHDIVKEKQRSTIVETGLDKVFTVEAARKYFNLVGTMDPSNIHNYYSILSVGGTDYLVIVMEYAPNDAVLEWASSVVQQYPDSKIIYVTHSYLTRFGYPANYPADEEVGSLANTGMEIWQKLVSKHANSYMVLSGHVWSSKPSVPHLIAHGDAGQPIYELLFDYQNQPHIGNGWFGLLTFHPDNSLEVRIYSPYLEEYSNTRDESGFASYLVIKHD